MEPKEKTHRDTISALPSDKSTKPLSSGESSNLSNKENAGLLKEGILILVVDDLIDNVVLLSIFLQDKGYKVISASNGEEAVQVATLARPNIILMDIGMPLLDGLGATTKIREDPTLQNIPIIAVTAFSTAGFRRAAYDVGFDGYVAKPIDFELLQLLINSLLSKQSLSNAEAEAQLEPADDKEDQPSG